MTSLPVVAIFGTSISEGYNDLNYISYIAQALEAAKLPYIGLGKGSESMSILTGATHHRARYPLAASATDIICEHGVNDGAQAGTTTFGTWAGRYQTLWAQLKALGGGGKRVWQCTMPPSYASSTDSFATLANQTAAAGSANRIILNDWIRAGAPQDSGGVAVVAGTAGAVANPNLRGYFEVADTLESARNSGLWKVNGSALYATNDGTHPSSAGHLLAVSAIDTSAIIAAYNAALTPVPKNIKGLVRVGGTFRKIVRTG